MTDPYLTPLGPQLPRRGNAFSRGFFTVLLRLLGWRVTGDFPDVRKAVLIVAPHTSRFDGFIAVVSAFALGLRLSFFLKHSAFRFPWGGPLRCCGALPVDREQEQDLVAHAAAQLRAHDRLLLAVAPEGRRRAAAHWQTGFYRIAHQAQVPIVCLAFDYALREVRVVGLAHPTGNIERELPQIIALYRGITPRHEDRLSAPLRALRAGPRR